MADEVAVVEDTATSLSIIIVNKSRRMVRMITIIRELFQHCSRVIDVTRNALLLQYYDRCYGLSIFVTLFVFLKTVDSNNNDNS